MKPSCRGSSLIESLVAMAVFAVGSAASGAWFAASMGVDARASRRVAAAHAVADLRERMAANREGVAAGYYASPVPALPNCEEGCMADALAADDLRRFRDALRRQVGPAAAHTWHCEGMAACRVRVTWQGKPMFTATFLP
jgi:prepilin-type N-terminal cleavage/methylation domain-containing protein